MENNKIVQTAKRASVLLIIFGLLATFFAIASFFVVVSLLDHPVLVGGVGFFLLLTISIIWAGIRISKNRENLQKVRGSIVWGLVVSIFSLIGSVQRIFMAIGNLDEATLSKQSLLMAAFIILSFVLSLILFKDLLKLSKAAKTQTVTPTT